MELLFALLFAVFGISDLYAGIVLFKDTTRIFQGLHITVGVIFLVLSIIYFAGAFV